MGSKFRNRFGVPGVLAVIALVFALAGGAYAASNALSGKQKKEVEKIAKKYAGKPGPAGPVGSTGAAGKDGSNGKDGAAGKDGSPGGNGTSATTAAIPTSSATCNHFGGVEVKSASAPQNVCNGATGYTEFLPEGKSETGAWVIGATGVATPTLVSIPISFPIPLEAAGEEDEETGEFPNEIPIVYMAPNAVANAECPGTALEPAAAPGFLCVYATTTLEADLVARRNPENDQTGIGTGKSGALLTFNLKTASAFARGNWVLTAP